MSSQITCMVLDDEPMATALLLKHLSYLFPNVEVLNTFTSWEEAVSGIKKYHPDIIFMDISMPGKSGLDVLNLIPNVDAEVIFVTAHSEHALSAFKFSPSGYVLKPIDDAQLNVAVSKAIERVQHKRIAKAKTSSNIEPKIGIADKRGTDYVKVKDIVYIEGLKGTTKIVTTDRLLSSSSTLQSFATSLAPYSFVQVHRSFIVNLNHIIRYTNDGGIVMMNGDSVPLSRNSKEEFQEKFIKMTKNSGS